MAEQENRRPSFGELLHFYRERADLSPQDLENFITTPSQQIIDWETNKAFTIKKYQLLKLKDIFNLSDEEFGDWLKSMGSISDQSFDQI